MISGGTAGGYRLRARLSAFSALLLMCLGAWIMLYPYLYAIGSSFKTRAEFTSDGHHVITLSGSDQQLKTLQLSVRKWDLAEDKRPVEDLVRLAQLLSCGELNAGGGATSLDPGALTNLWLTLPAKYPAQFGAPTSGQILAWHRRLATESERSRQWSACRRRVCRRAPYWTVVIFISIRN